MKTSISTKFTLGIVFFFIIIAVLSGLSAFEMNMLSKKTSAILTENHVSVVCAREMTDALTNIDQEFSGSFIQGKDIDSISVKNEISLFGKSLLIEKNNITEVGEDKLVSAIELGFQEYRNSVASYLKLPNSVDKFIPLQKRVVELQQQLILLSQMNEKAIELKTNDAKISSKKALIQMTIFGTLCFLITLSFTYSFASYFNERFFQLHNGIKEIVSSNYGQRLYFDGKDEFNEIALAFNKMAEKLNENMQNIPVSLKGDSEKEIDVDELHELKSMLGRMKIIEEQANEIISKFKSSLE